MQPSETHHTCSHMLHISEDNGTDVVMKRLVKSEVFKEDLKELTAHRQHEGQKQGVGSRLEKGH